LTIKVTTSELTKDDGLVGAMLKTPQLMQALAVARQQPNFVLEGPLWQEHTGKEVGWIRKTQETKYMPLKGKRCENCGYTEIYVVDE